jgi:two-component system KDP operon response regulator KdpE
MNIARRILIVDGDADPTMLRAGLTAQGYEVSVVESGAEGLQRLRAGAFDLVLLELDLPDRDGTSFIPAARQISSAPIIVLSVRAGQGDKVRALDLGASDYLTKPFDMAELQARIRVALRAQDAGPPPQLRADRLRIDLETRRAVVDGRAVRLSARECAILQVLAEAGGRGVSLADIIARVWSGDRDAEPQHVRVLVWQVRRKIEPDPTRPCFLISEPAVGYRLHLGGLAPSEESPRPSEQAGLRRG